MSCSRSVFLNDINSFIVDTKSYLSDVLSKLGWSEECYTYEKNKSDDRGDGSNDLKSDVYRNSDSVEPCYNFNLSDNATDISDVLTLPKSVKKCKEESLLDILARERDMKRRRISYKGRIHTKHKSHNEILREVIAQQMDLIGDSSSLAVETAETPTGEEAEAIDLSRMYVDNPHLAWKYVSKEYKQIMRERQSDGDKRHTSKSDCSKETSRAKYRNDRKSDGKSRYIRNRDPSDDQRQEYEVKKVRRKLHSDSEDEISDMKRSYNGNKNYHLNGDNETKHNSLNYLSDSDRGLAKVNLNEEKYKHHNKIKEKNKSSYNNDKHKGYDDDDSHRKKHKRKEESKKKSKESKDIYLKKHKKRSRSRSKKRRRRSKSS